MAGAGRAVMSAARVGLSARVPTVTGAPQCKAGSGNIYADEGNHWDAAYCNCGGRRLPYRERECEFVRVPRPPDGHLCCRRSRGLRQPRPNQVNA